MRHRPFQAFVEPPTAQYSGVVLGIGRSFNVSNAVVCSRAREPAMGGRLRWLSVVLVTEANNGAKTGVSACQAAYCARLHESLGMLRLG
jgi:hypothetical protein